MIHKYKFIALVSLLVIVLVAGVSIQAFAETYQNNRKGFSVGYPDNWYVTEDSARQLITFKPKVDTDPCKCTVFGVGVTPVSYSYILQDLIGSMKIDIHL